MLAAKIRFDAVIFGQPVSQIGRSVSVRCVLAGALVELAGGQWRIMVEMHFRVGAVQESE
jgi:hypothetical protein